MSSSQPKTYKISDWEKHFKKHGIKDELIDSYLHYIKKCYRNNVPVIFETEHLAKLFGRSYKFVVSVINANDYFYRSFTIPKRRGGERTISSPYPSLIECQEWIKSNILETVDPHTSTHAFQSGKSFITNAQKHVDNTSLLKIDLKDFFPSIEKNRLIHFFSRLGYTKKISLALSQFCTLEDSLPQGAPTSPILCNILNIQLDKRLYALADKFDFVYTRYADDLTFSGKHIPAKFIEYVEEIILDEGYEINNDKTLLKNGQGKKIVTGVSIASGELKLPRKYKRDLRQELYYINKYGYFGHAKSEGIRDPYYLSKLLGKVSYWISVESENQEAKDYKNMLIEIINSLDLAD